MQQRQPRVGDIVDDYCPRERRLTDHAIVAMVGDGIRLVRCATCDAEHEYKQAKVPVIRKRKDTAKAASPAAPPRAAPEGAPDDEPQPGVEGQAAPDESQPLQENGHEGPVHRRLIRATLPRVEGQVPARPIPEFTMHRANTPAKSFRGKSFRPGPGGASAGSGGRPGKSGGPHARHGQAKHGGQAGGFGQRGSQGGGQRPPRGPHGGGAPRGKKH